jgi:hypothetical protein
LSIPASVNFAFTVWPTSKKDASLSAQSSGSRPMALIMAVATRTMVNSQVEVKPSPTWMRSFRERRLRERGLSWIRSNRSERVRGRPGPPSKSPESEPLTGVSWRFDNSSNMGLKRLRMPSCRSKLCPYCDGWDHRDGRLIAYSESPDKAADLGLTLLGWSSQVTVVTNGQRLEQHDRHRLAQARIAFAEERIVRLHHRGRRLRLVEFERGEPLEATALFFAASQRQQCDLPERLGCVKQRAFLDASDQQRASIPGVYLAGDADGDVQFAIVAAAEGAKAAVVINKGLLSEDRETMERTPAQRPRSAPLSASLE